MANYPELPQSPQWVRQAKNPNPLKWVRGINPTTPRYPRGGIPIGIDEMEDNAASLSKLAGPYDTIRPQRPQDTMSLEMFDRNFDVFNLSPAERDRVMGIWGAGMEGWTEDLKNKRDPFNPLVPIKRTR